MSGIVIDEDEVQTTSRKSRMGQIKPGYIAILGSEYLEAHSKRDLIKMLDAGDHQDAVIIRGKIVPTCRITKLSF